MDKCARFFHCIRACSDAVARVSEIRTLSSYDYGCRDCKHEFIDGVMEHETKVFERMTA
jgi:hypothetical protein